jgi:hypothetical protein
LHKWRTQFAENLRELGIAANATERAVRGEVRTPKKDGIYRAAPRAESTHQRQEVHGLRERAPDSLRRFTRASETLKRTRAAVVAGWQGVARQLEEAGAYELAEDVQRFVGRMPPPTPDQRLAQLLSADPCMDEGFSDARFLFSEEEKHGLATHLYYSAVKHWDEETYSWDGRDALPPEPSQQEVDADEKQIGILHYWLDDALKREAPSPCQIIERFATSAEMVAKNPPFVSTGDAAHRYVFLLSGSLMVIFNRWFRSPLDEIVAAIATVTSSGDVSADAVKMRRNRWCKHYARPLDR